MADTSAIVSNVMQSIPGLVTLLNVITSFLGVALTGYGVFKFIEYGKGEGHTKLITPFLLLFCGTALWNFNASIDTFLGTVFGSSSSTSNLLSYSPSANTTAKAKLWITMLIMLLRVYGYFTFMRAWLTISKIGSGQHANDELGKTAIVRLFAGIALINIVETVNVLSTTVGFGDVL